MTYIGVYIIVMEKQIIQEWVQSDYIFIKTSNYNKEKQSQEVNKSSQRWIQFKVFPFFFIDFFYNKLFHL